MPERHKKFHSVNGKRLILVVDDEQINREMLGFILQEKYEVLFAKDGGEALEKIRENEDLLTLVLLDLQLPGIHGMEILHRMQDDPKTKKIPVIVMTSEQSSEVESLRSGAIDFIPKPYPQPEVVLARVERTIELSEDQEIILATERDHLTGLYSLEYFYKYAEQFDQYHRDTEMDAIVIDIDHFHMINERYGRAYGDEVLRRVGEKVREMVLSSGGIVCRREGDTFLVYCPHVEDHAVILENASIDLEGEGSGKSGRIRLRMGIYEYADKEMDIERRFDRAKAAADSVRSGFAGNIAKYDEALAESELYDEQLLEDFQAALDERQFVVYFQPQFYIRTERPYLNSAEALVRWNHPQLGMISPGRFIPLFENNGLIRTLDQYVWREAARQTALWKEKFGISIPVSVNVSRVDMFDPNLLGIFRNLLDEFRLSSNELHLEITESAYTTDADQIINTVKQLREMGMMVEMDDFGTGYSSLGMISHLPLDILKLDMVFIRNAFVEHRDVRMLEIIIDIADFLNVPVVAEGVETKEQMLTLKAMGCDLVQGYYFSKPLPADEFEAFIEQRAAKLRENEKMPSAQEEAPAEENAARIPYISIANALSSDFELIYYVDTSSDFYIEFSPQGRHGELRIQRGGDDFFKDIQKTFVRAVYEEDRHRVAEALRKETLLSQLAENPAYSLTCRLVQEELPVYYSVKAVHSTSTDDHHIVIGVSDVDAQMRREQEYGLVKELANRDALTGVKSKHAFDQTESTLNEEIEEHDVQPFSVVVCDVNGLKQVNDTQGHTAGDRLLRRACMEICNIFKHSPVYRIGGDEFAVVVRGRDYAMREDLIDELDEMNREGIRGGGVVVARGISDFDPLEDASFRVVFDRADAAMYENKKALKSL